MCVSSKSPKMYSELIWCRSSFITRYMLSHVRLFAAPWAVALQAPQSVGISQARILEWVASSYSILTGSIILIAVATRVF